MAATHLLVLKDPGLPFARFFPSVRGDDAEPPEAAGAEFAAFCAENRDELARILRERLVQTNAPGRGVAVRLAMHEIGRRVTGRSRSSRSALAPGSSCASSAGRWRRAAAGSDLRRAADPVLRSGASADPPPDLDDLPPVRDRLGVDLHPVDATDPEQRLWLQALVWPEHRDRFTELATALDAVAADPPEILQGDAIELLPPPGRGAAARRHPARRLPRHGPHPRPRGPPRRLRCGDRRARRAAALLHVSLETSRAPRRPPRCSPCATPNARTGTSPASRATAAGSSRWANAYHGHRLGAPVCR